MPSVQTHLNLSVILGEVATEPTLKFLSRGETVMSLNVRVRPVEKGPSQVVPVSWIEPPEWASALQVGQSVVIVGHTRQVWFGQREKFTDVLVESMAKATGPAAVRKALARAIDVVENATP